MANATSNLATRFIDSVESTVDYLADLLRGIVKGIKGIAPLVVGLAGCQSGSVDASVSPPPMPREIAKTPAPVVEPEPQPIGTFNVTFYYVIGEEEVAAKAAVQAVKAAKAKAANDNKLDPEIEPELVSIVPPQMVTIYEGGTCDPITEVTRDYAMQLSLQGTGKLKDGRVINVWGHCRCKRSPCFKVTTEKWGTAGTGRALQPFRTVAVDPKVVKLGSLLHVPLLEGRMMPGRAPWGGFVHDGCVVADDTGGGIEGKQLDLFVGRRAYFHAISNSGGSHAWARHVPVYDGSKLCQRKGRKVTRKASAS